MEKDAELLKRQKIKGPTHFHSLSCWFDYEENNKGYWTYKHFVLQCEDVVNCLSVLCPEIDVHLYVNHSCGHDLQRDNGLDCTKMNKGYGGKQQIMHETKRKMKVILVLTHQSYKLDLQSNSHSLLLMMDPFGFPANYLCKRQDVKTRKT